MNEKKYNVEDRLVQFAADTILFTKLLPYDDAGRYFRDQLTRSACAAALNFGESQGTDSIKDSVHKLGMVIKELKESRVSLKIVTKLKIGDPPSRTLLLSEVEELIAIAATIRKNKNRGD
ncbi:MAG TPA: four helix bundle protein [Saprospiraceae bacterium]|nr:four helix bundle protein [Saprospiraceae bacterium]